MREDEARIKPASWVVVSESGEAIFETYEIKTVEKILKTGRYKAIPIMEYLCNLNARIKATSR